MAKESTAKKRLEGLRKQISPAVKSPVDWTRSVVKILPLNSDSMNIDVQVDSANLPEH